MINKININKFGLFEAYSWDSTIGKQETFRRLNIIYGRNYSGKTTISRILKCVEDNRLHENYKDCDFQLIFSDGSIITQKNLSDISTKFKIRVYNTDFVKENLSWLHNDDGTIKPFTILGAKNIEIDKAIKSIDDQLGNIEEKKGLLFDHSKATLDHQTKSTDFFLKKDYLDDKLRSKAKMIKTNGSIYNVPTYTINSIIGDIPIAKTFEILSDEQIQERKKLLKEEPKPQLDILHESKPNFSNYYQQTKELIATKIKPSEPIAELINDSLLQEWVRQGIDKHKNKRKTCGFCGNIINDNLWGRLDAHFSKESEDLRNEIKTKIEQLEQAKNKLSEFLDISKDSFYSNNHIKFEALIKSWNSTTKTYSKNIDLLIQKLKEREKDIFNAREIGEISDVSQSLFEIIQEFNILIVDHNKKTSSLSADQQTARKELRISEVAKFIKDIDYSKKQDEIDKLETQSKDSKKEVTRVLQEIEKLNEEKRNLEAQSKDESKGAELVNMHLTHFFGHNELKLVAEGISPNILFRIVRNSQYANNLSEGECSLVSFCYFIARMEDELKEVDNNSKLIIFLDDPISSLDSNHIFFMFSLIESVIAKSNRYCQLFIATHNLDFLKYLKKLTSPKYKPTAESKESKADKKYFLIERKSKALTILRLAPDYLKNYITEFNYLFFQIHNCSLSSNEKIIHDYQYNFGNNMRKFLEAYLFYKYPSNSQTFDQRIEKFFDSDEVSINLVNRVINEYSHLGEHFDRGLEPIDVDVIKKISEVVMNRIETLDKDQFAALIESVKEIQN